MENKLEMIITEIANFMLYTKLIGFDFASSQ